MKKKRITLICGIIIVAVLLVIVILLITKKKDYPDNLVDTQYSLGAEASDDVSSVPVPETESGQTPSEPVWETESEFPETMEKLLGEWISLDGSTTCTVNTNSILIHFLGNEAVPEESYYYEYELVSDTQMSITYAGSAPSVYTFSIWEKDGETYFTSPIKTFASTYVRASSSPDTPQEEETSTDVEVILDSHEIDYNEYNEEFKSIIGEILIGTWKGTYDYWENADSSYYVFTFLTDGTYTYSYEDYSETGTYIFTCDLNNKFSSTMYLTNADGERSFNFNVSQSEPYKMNTDEDYPTLTKE